MKNLKFTLIASILGLSTTLAVATPFIVSCSSNQTTQQPQETFNPVLKSKFDSTKVQLKTGNNQNDLKPNPESSFKIDDTQQNNWKFIINLAKTDQYFALDLSKLKPTDLYDNVNDNYKLSWEIQIDAQPNTYDIQVTNGIVKNTSPINESNSNPIYLKLKLTISYNQQNKHNYFWFVVNKANQDNQLPPLPPEIDKPPVDDNNQNNKPPVNDGNQPSNKPITVEQAKPQFGSSDGLVVSNNNIKFDKEVSYQQLQVGHLTDYKQMSSDISTAMEEIFINTNHFVDLNEETLFPPEIKGWSIGNIDITTYIPTDVNPTKPNLIVYIDLYPQIQNPGDNKPIITPTKTRWCFSITGFNDASLKSNYDIYLSKLVNNMNEYLGLKYLTIKFNKSMSNITTSDILAFDNNKIKKLLDASIWSLNNILLGKQVLGLNNKSLILTKQQTQSINYSSFEFKINKYQPDSLSSKDPINLYKETNATNINQISIKFKDVNNNKTLAINNWFVFDNRAQIINESNILTELQSSINQVYDLINKKITDLNNNITSNNDKYQLIKDVNIITNTTNPFNDLIINNEILNSDFITKKFHPTNYDYKYKISNYLLWYSLVNILANNKSFDQSIKPNLLSFDIINNHLAIKYNNQIVETKISLNKTTNETNAIDDVESLTDKIADVISQDLSDKTINVDQKTLIDNNSFHKDIQEFIKTAVGTTNLQIWIDSLLNTTIINSNYVLLNNHPYLINAISYDFYLNKFNDSFLDVHFELTDITNNISRQISISNKPIKLNISLNNQAINQKVTNINLKQPSIKIQDLVWNNLMNEASINYFLDSFKNKQDLINFVYTSRFVLFNNSNILTKDMILDANLNYIDNINPSKPELNLSVKLKNQPQDLIIRIINFNDASLETNYQYYFQSLVVYINDLVRNSSSLINNYIDASNNLDANQIYNIWTNYSFNNQIYLSSTKPFELMTNKDYIDAINVAIKRLNPNLDFNQLINKFNNSYIHSISINALNEGNDVSIILTPTQKQQLDANAFNFSKTTKELSSVNYDNNLYTESGYDAKLKTLISEWKLDKSQNDYLTISFNKPSQVNMVNNPYVSNYLIQTKSSQLDINQYLTYMSQIINKIISIYLQGFNKTVSINIPNNLTLQQQNSWISSSIFATKWNTSEKNTFSFRDIFLMSNFILHIKNYSLPTDFDFTKLGFSVNNQKQLVIKYEDNAQQVIDLMVKLEGWNSIDSKDYINNFGTYVNQLLNNNAVKLSKFELKTIPFAYSSDSGLLYLKNIYISKQIYKSLDFDSRLKVSAINSSYSALINNKNYYDDFLKYNPVLTAFNYESANKKIGFMNIDSPIKINNKQVNLKMTMNLWSNVDGLNNYISMSTNPLIFDFDGLKINVSTTFGRYIKQKPTDLNLKVNLTQ